MYYQTYIEAKVTFIETFILKMSREYGLFVKVRFHKGWRTRCESCGDPSTTIVFGHKAILQDYRYFCDYKTMKWLWEAYEFSLTGKKALWACAIHEFAHVLQQDRRRGTVHTEGWISAVQELQVLYPFEDVKSL